MGTKAQTRRKSKKSAPAARPIERDGRLAAAAAEIRGMMASCQELTDQIIEAKTNTDEGAASEAFESALSGVLALRIVMADVVYSLEHEPAGAS